MRFFSQKNRPTRKRVGVCMWERGQLDGGGCMRAAEARRLQMDQVDLMDQMDKTGAPLNTPWVGGAAGWNDSERRSTAEVCCGNGGEAQRDSRRTCGITAELSGDS